MKRKTAKAKPRKIPAWRLAKALEKLRGQVNALAPRRNKASDGTIGDAAHFARTSDHVPNADGVVTAADLTHDPTNDCDAGAIAESLRFARDHRVKYVIWNRMIFSSLIAPWSWRPYAGANPHTKHVHISVLPEACDCEVRWGVETKARRQMKRTKEEE
jgi:hypothetical protein